MAPVTDLDEHDLLDANDAPAGFVPGEPIALEDLLALPADGRPWGRDEAGRLCLLGPESAEGHVRPISLLMRWLNLHLAPPFEVYAEPGLALPVLLKLGGEPVPESRLGPRSIEPDLAVFRDRPRALPIPLGEPCRFPIDDLGIAIEILSPATFRSDLGLGRADAVDRWTSCLRSGVPELWILNVRTSAPCPIPPRSGLFLRNDGGAWAPLPVDGLRPASPQVHGFTAVAGGVVRSTVADLRFDLDAFWRDVAPQA